LRRRRHRLRRAFICLFVCFLFMLTLNVKI